MQRNGGEEEEKQNGSSKQRIPLFKKKKNRNKEIYSPVKICEFFFFTGNTFSVI